MQDLINSMVKFSAAMTLFSMQQMQNVVDAATDTDDALNKFRDALDAVTNAIKGQLDENKKPTLDSLSNLGTDIVDRTWDTVDGSVMDPRKVLRTTSDLMKKTSESIADLVKKSSTSESTSEHEETAATGA